MQNLPCSVQRLEVHEAAGLKKHCSYIENGSSADVGLASVLTNRSCVSSLHHIGTFASAGEPFPIHVITSLILSEVPHQQASPRAAPELLLGR